MCQSDLYEPFGGVPIVTGNEFYDESSTSDLVLENTLTFKPINTLVGFTSEIQTT